MPCVSQGNVVLCLRCGDISSNEFIKMLCWLLCQRILKRQRIFENQFAVYDVTDKRLVVSFLIYSGQQYFVSFVCACNHRNSLFNGYQLWSASTSRWMMNQPINGSGNSVTPFISSAGCNILEMVHVYYELLRMCDISICSISTLQWPRITLNMKVFLFSYCKSFIMQFLMFMQQLMSATNVQCVCWVTRTINDMLCFVMHCSVPMH